LAKVISSDNLAKHTMEKYTFQVFSMGASSASDEVEKEKVQNDIPKPIVTSEVDSSSLSTGSKDSLIESLLKKTDEMSSNFIKLQMKLEDMTEEHKAELQKMKEDSFEEGAKAGVLQAKEESEDNFENGLNQFSTSVTTLEKSASEFEVALEGIKSHLVEAALDIAKEVIKIELNTNSTEIATVLSNELINELQSASKITLKVNPKDHGEVSKNVGSLKHVEVLSDGAISEGGVVVLSDAGNIDAQITKRFEKVKRAALSE